MGLIASAARVERQAILRPCWDMENIEIRTFDPDNRDWLISQHREHYCAKEGFDESFGVLVTQIIDDFIDGHDPKYERG